MGFPFYLALALQGKKNVLRSGGATPLIYAIQLIGIAFVSVTRYIVIYERNSVRRRRYSTLLPSSLTIRMEESRTRFFYYEQI